MKARAINGEMDMAASFAIEQPAVMCSLDNKIMKQIFIIGLIFAAFTSASLATDLNTAKIDNLTGLKGKMNEKEGVYKVTFPRNEMDGPCRPSWDWAPGLRLRKACTRKRW